MKNGLFTACWNTWNEQELATYQRRRAMSAPAKQLKEVVRLQFDVRRAQLNIIEKLVEVCGLSSKKELFSNSMALMKWAVQETQKGRRIASYDPDRDEIEMVALPALDLIEQPSEAGLVSSRFR
jgi:hypothetical protein